MAAPQSGGSRNGCTQCLRTLAEDLPDAQVSVKYASTPAPMLLPQRAELGLTFLSQMSIVVQISAFMFSLAHSGIDCRLRKPSFDRLLKAVRLRR